MDIKMSPRKSGKPLDVVHNGANTSPEEARRVLTCTPEQAFTNAMYSPEGEEMWNEFVREYGRRLAAKKREIEEYHEDCNLIINSQLIKAIKDLIKSLRDKYEMEVKYEPDVDMDYLGTKITLLIKGSISFEPTDMFINACDWYHPTVDAVKEGRYVRIEFFVPEIGQYVKR